MHHLLFAEAVNTCKKHFEIYVYEWSQSYYKGNISAQVLLCLLTIWSNGQFFWNFMFLDPDHNIDTTQNLSQ